MKAMLDACLEQMKANPGEPQFLAVLQEVPKEEAAVDMIGALKGQPGDRHLAVGRRRQTNKRTQDNGGSRKKLAAARGRLYRRTISAPRNGHCLQGPGKDETARGIRIRLTFENSRRARHNTTVA
jgi:hypothetical protein